MISARTHPEFSRNRKEIAAQEEEREDVERRRTKRPERLQTEGQEKGGGVSSHAADNRTSLFYRKPASGLTSETLTHKQLQPIAR